MDGNDITSKGDLSQAPTSTPDDLLKAVLADRERAVESDDGLTNPELEQLIGSLATGGLPEGPFCRGRKHTANIGAACFRTPALCRGNRGGTGWG